MTHFAMQAFYPPGCASAFVCEAEMWGIVRVSEKKMDLMFSRENFFQTPLNFEF